MRLRAKKGEADEPLPAVPPERRAADPAHTQLEIAKAIRTLLGSDDDELLRQRRAEIAAARRDLDALVRDVRKLGEDLPALVMADLQSELKKSAPTSRVCRPAIPMAGSGRAGVRSGAKRRQIGPMTEQVMPAIHGHNMLRPRSIHVRMRRAAAMPLTLPRTILRFGITCGMWALRSGRETILNVKKFGRTSFLKIIQGPLSNSLTAMGLLSTTMRVNQFFGLPTCRRKGTCRRDWQTHFPEPR
jgi:hypothetical protein